MANHRFSWLLLCVALMVFGCEGERGPAGPAGTANVIYSGWYSPETWILESSFGVSERTFTMTTSALTQEIIDNGVVMVYMRFIGYYPEIIQLPVSITDLMNDYHFLFRSQEGSIKALYYWTNNPTADPGIIPSGNQIRYVLIHGGALDEVALSEGVTLGQLVGSLDSMTYQEVCSLLDIPE